MQKILIVDDSEINREILAAMLEKTYEIDMAKDGQEAIEILEKKWETYQIVLLDLNMPVMNGYEVLKVMEEKQWLDSLPVICISAETSEASIGKAYELGATDYFTRPFDTAEFDVLTKITGFKLTRGMLCAMHRRKLPSMREICENAKRIAVLEEVVNPTNIGAIFRSAAAMHMDAVLLTPACSNPLYRRAIRVSMGTVFQIPWTFVDNSVSWPEGGIQLLHKMGFKMAALALSGDSIRIDDPILQKEEKLAILLGTEGDGLTSRTIADCDYTVKIPMSHGVGSLNVAAASAVAFWQLRKEK